MESVKKQAEAILELESELSKSKKQERAYEEAIEALQGDLDTMEQEINKLKVVISTSDKQGNIFFFLLFQLCFELTYEFRSFK